MNRCAQWHGDIICLIIFFVSITIRLVKMVFEPLILRDAAFFLKAAEIWNKTGDYQELPKEFVGVPPLPLWCIKTLMSFCGSSEIAGRSISIFLGGLISVVGFILAREITHNIRISLIVALCCILHPILVAYSIQPLRENYFILLIGILLIVMVRNYRNPKTLGWIVCGAIVGIAVCCRHEALEFLFVVAAEIAVLELKWKTIVTFLKSISLFFLAFALMFLLVLSCTNGEHTSVYRLKIYYDKATTDYNSVLIE